ncbi:lipoprotein [Roseobacter cerasinus]|uniref:Lipoprotein n=1 Tax=Roseobacter cerasinus TaxID=2602289 RepID=A0A640VUQ2_9RHOB|nr:DUF3299 domain-containing protein [Roseobacter cerasinus]GFE50821.1 lipoprotein [Roseobacter cerasinus]
MMILTRRHMIMSGLAGLALTGPVRATAPRNVAWDDLIPPGVPYGEIIGEGEIDVVNDTWNPIYDENATKLNEALDGAYVRMPGYIIPMELGSNGVSEFMLVPYVGACIHVPPPPPNQLIFVTSKTPWLGGNLWDAVWVTGTLRTEMQSTELADTGYTVAADVMELYEW